MMGTPLAAGACGPAEGTVAVAADVTTTTQPATPPVPAPAEVFAARWATMTEPEHAAFVLMAATPEQRDTFARFITPPPPPPPAPAPKSAPAPAPKVQPAPTPKATPPPAAAGGGAPANAFLACVRQHESRGSTTCRR